MKLYVHSAGRADAKRQHTIKSLPITMLKDVFLVVQASQAKEYEPVAVELRVRMLVLPKHIKTLSPTRQWILENADTEKFVLLDDDLVFAKRTKDNRFLTTEGAEVVQMFRLIKTMLDKWTHVGVLDRSGANRVVGVDYVENTRMMRLLAYRKSKVLKVGARFDRVITKQDFDMTLQLLRAGHANAVITGYVQDQRGGSNAPGGCSAYRTQPVSDKAAEQLRKLHPDYVKVVTKATKRGWFNPNEPGERVDVQIAWKKAFHGGAK